MNDQNPLALRRPVINPLCDIPDFGVEFQTHDIKPWINERITALSRDSLERSVLDSFTNATVRPDSSEADKRKMLAGLMLADWACFSAPADRVDLPRLRSVTDIFPGGFRLWLCQLTDGKYTPVGYTGWYPISGEVVETMRNRPMTIPDRGFMKPLPALDPDGGIYVFNYSILEGLRRMPYSRTLLQTLHAELLHTRPLPTTAVAVSEEGIRVAKRLGMHITGMMRHMGEEECVMMSPIARPLALGRRAPG